MSGTRILLVRLREIGDVVFTTPAIGALRRHFPSARISYVVEPHAAPVLRHNPNIDDLIVAPRVHGFRGTLEDIRLGRRLRAERFDLAIDFHGGPRASLLTWLSGARERIGYEIVGRGWMYTRRVPRPRALRARHSVENQWDLLRALDIAPPDRDRDAVGMAADPVAVDAVSRRLLLAGVSGEHELIVIHVSAGNPFRRWPLEHFVALTTTLAAGPLRRIVLSSGPSETAAADEVRRRARAALDFDAGPRVLDCGEFSLAELRALLDRAALSSAGTAVRSISPRPPACPSSGCMGRRYPSDRRRGGARDCRWPRSTSACCRAGPATSVSARQVTSAASHGFRRNAWPRPR
jgi:ADP-heptose:LPS heptosyltransferase